jgi:hypothetical protein
VQQQLRADEGLVLNPQEYPMTIRVWAFRLTILTATALAAAANAGWKWDLLAH